MTITGDRGVVRVGYQTAAVIGPWRLVRTDDYIGNNESHGSATIQAVNSFWITQRPVTISMWMGAAWWTWTDASIEADKLQMEFRLRGTPVVSKTM